MVGLDHLKLLHQLLDGPGLFLWLIVAVELEPTPDLMLFPVGNRPFASFGVRLHALVVVRLVHDV